tara:strand:+ start:341 stop:913 length:573 start_codon:yes stop_codon:yes gene_type:complete
MKPLKTVLTYLGFNRPSTRQRLQALEAYVDRLDDGQTQNNERTLRVWGQTKDIGWRVDSFALDIKEQAERIDELDSSDELAQAAYELIDLDDIARSVCDNHGSDIAAEIDLSCAVSTALESSTFDHLHASEELSEIIDAQARDIVTLVAKVKRLEAIAEKHETAAACVIMALSPPDKTQGYTRTDDATDW